MKLRTKGMKSTTEKEKRKFNIQKRIEAFIYNENIRLSIQYTKKMCLESFSTNVQSFTCTEQLPDLSVFHSMNIAVGLQFLDELHNFLLVKKFLYSFEAGSHYIVVFCHVSKNYTVHRLLQLHLSCETGRYGFSLKAFCDPMKIKYFLQRPLFLAIGNTSYSMFTSHFRGRQVYE